MQDEVMSQDLGIDIDDEIVEEGISDGSEYSPKAEFKKPLLVMEAVQFARSSRAKEMIKGFWNNKVDKHGNAIRIWMPDERKMFINSVVALETLLAPEISRDETYKKAVDVINKSIDAVYKKYAYTSYEYDSKQNGFVKTDVHYMPQLDEELMVRSPQNPLMLINIRGAWDGKVNAYYDELVPLYDGIFREVCNLIDRLNDFKRVMRFG
jgi:hypothetical protein